jgi:chorismate mutase
MDKPTRSEADAEIAACRTQIDAIDEALVKLLDERIAIALTIGRAKRTAGLATRVPEREAMVLRRVAELAQQPSIVRAFATIVEVTREAQNIDDAAE